MAPDIGNPRGQATSRGSSRSRGTSAPPRQVKRIDSPDFLPSNLHSKRAEEQSPNKTGKIKETGHVLFQSNPEEKRVEEICVEERYARNVQSVAIVDSIISDGRRRSLRARTLHAHPTSLLEPSAYDKKFVKSESNPKQLLSSPYPDTRRGRKKSVGWADAPQITYFSTDSAIKIGNHIVEKGQPSEAATRAELLDTSGDAQNKVKKPRARSWIPRAFLRRDSSLPAPNSRMSHSSDADSSKKRVRSFKEMFDLLQKRQVPPKTK